MAGINLKQVILEDKWPGVANQNFGIPTDGFDSSSAGQDQTTAMFPLGTKITAYQSAADASDQPGYYTMIYLNFHGVSGRNDITDISGAQCVVQPFCNSVVSDSTDNFYHVTNVGGLATGYKCATQVGRIAIACGTVTSDDITTDGGSGGYFGWYWCGGVCPYADITFFDKQSGGAGADLSTDGNVAAGKMIIPIVDTSALIIGLGEASAGIQCGYALKDDA